MGSQSSVVHPGVALHNVILRGEHRGQQCLQMERRSGGGGGGYYVQCMISCFHKVGDTGGGAAVFAHRKRRKGWGRVTMCNA